jgi:ATP-dependent DNA helicase RecG
MEKSELQNLVRELISLPRETEWVEFKHNKADPSEIGEYVSALSNSAALYGKPCAYAFWGVADTTRQVVGTMFRPRLAKVGNEELENWLLTQLEPRVDVRIHEGLVDSKSIVILDVLVGWIDPNLRNLHVHSNQNVTAAS